MSPATGPRRFDQPWSISILYFPSRPIRTHKSVAVKGWSVLEWVKGWQIDSLSSPSLLMHIVSGSVGSGVCLPDRWAESNHPRVWDCRNQRLSSPIALPSLGVRPPARGNSKNSHYSERHKFHGLWDMGYRTTTKRGSKEDEAHNGLARPPGRIPTRWYGSLLCGYSLSPAPSRRLDGKYVRAFHGFIQC